MIAQSTPVTPAWREDLAAAEAGIPGACHEAVNKILKTNPRFRLASTSLECAGGGRVSAALPQAALSRIRAHRRGSVQTPDVTSSE